MTGAMMELDALALLPAKVLPKKINKYACDGLGDAPDLHRWRASWVNDCDGYPECIALQAYPVTRLTPKGAWIAEHAIRSWSGGWEVFGDKGRFVLNGSGMSWAKQTQEEAIVSLAYRMKRWAQRMVHDYRRVVAAVDTMERLRPDFGMKISKARMALATIKTEQISYNRDATPLT